MYSDPRYPGVLWQGTIMDLREDDAYLATPGWPEMARVWRRGYTRQVRGVWRACLHPRGFNAAGLCFDCLFPLAAPLTGE